MRFVLADFMHETQHLLMAGIVLVAGPGVCNEDLFSRSFESIRRPMFPFDDVAEPAALAN